MKKTAFVFPLLFVVLSACSQKTPITKDVSPKELKEHITKSKAIIVDVRTPEEVAQGKIPHSMNINYFGNFKLEVEKLDKTKPVYVYCASGGRSTKAMQDLSKMGFIEVYNLLGGFGAWRAAKFPVE